MIYIIHLPGTSTSIAAPASNTFSRRTKFAQTSGVMLVEIAPMKKHHAQI